jgi:hypothetical protein
MRGKKWGSAELNTLCKHYPILGAAGMLRAGYLADRPLGAITKRANILGLVCEVRAQSDAAPEAEVPLPRMDLLESLECVRLAKWKGPADRSRALVPAIGWAA